MLRFKKSLQSGIGLLELMLSISIMAVIIIVSVSYFESVSANQKITQANAMIADIYSASKNYVKAIGESDLSIEKMIEAGLLTSYYQTDPWGGSIEASLFTNQLSISMSNVPWSQCNRLVERLRQTFSNPADVTVAGTENAICQQSSSTLQVIYDIY